MWLAVLIDIIAVAAGIAIILAAVHDGSDRAAEDSTNHRARARSDARKNGARDSTCARADDRSSGRSSHGVIVARVCCATAQGKTARSCD